MPLIFKWSGEDETLDAFTTIVDADNGFNNTHKAASLGLRSLQVIDTNDTNLHYGEVTDLAESGINNYYLRFEFKFKFWSSDSLNPRQIWTGSTSIASHGFRFYDI